MLASEPEKYFVQNIQSGLESLENDKTLFFAPEATLREYRNKNPSKFPNLETFGRETATQCFAFTKNSPLFPSFKILARKSIETGLIEKLAKQWQGNPLETRNVNVDYTILSIGQMTMVFMIMVLAAVISFIVLSIECIKNYYGKT